MPANHSEKILEELNKLLSKFTENSIKILEVFPQNLVTKLVDAGLAQTLNARLNNPETAVPLQFLSTLLQKLGKNSDESTPEENPTLMKVKEQVQAKLFEIMQKEGDDSAEICRQIVQEQFEMVEEEEQEAEQEENQGMEEATDIGQ